MALILSVVALLMKGRKRGPAIAGAILGLAALITGITITALIAGAINKAAKEVTLGYSVTGDGKASVTYLTFTDGKIGTQQANDTALPWSETTKANGIFKSYTLLVVGNQDTTTITCTVTVDGEQVDTKTSTCPYAAVTCSGA